MDAETLGKFKGLTSLGTVTTLILASCEGLPRALQELGLDEEAVSLTLQLDSWHSLFQNVSAKLEGLEEDILKSST